MKAISVFSGGLDSILATLLIKESGIEVVPVFFSTPFFTPEKAIKSAENNNLPLKIVDITERYFDLLKKPKHGFGGNMNPCIDCHAMMLKIAGEMLEQENASFIISGEVLGQRPMSQNKVSLSLVEKESTMKSLIIRPLSAKLLPKTIPELNGWVDEKKLLAISGRSRKPQISLAKKLNVENYPAPAGGCLLTDPIFSRRLKDYMDNAPDIKRNEIELLKLGRHFRIDPETKIIVGRTMEENERIIDLSDSGGYTFNTITIPGPVVYVSGKRTNEMDLLASSMTVSYSDIKEGKTEIAVNHNGKQEIITGYWRDKNEFRDYLI